MTYNVFGGTLNPTLLLLGLLTRHWMFLHLNIGWLMRKCYSLGLTLCVNALYKLTFTFFTLLFYRGKTRPEMTCCVLSEMLISKLASL